ncbi:MAG TPA: hypothetical protein DHW63_01910 [Hyphomonadaceae bacterium]|nr:hypothetical protein [Hyphomonadaceae bacterium]
MSEEFDDDEVWDEDVVIDVRRFALEQALMAHLHKRDAPVDAAAVFALADRFANYVLGEPSP